MLEKFLSEKNISIEEIKKLFPDLAELIQSYQDIFGAEGFADDVDKIGREIVSLLKDRESQIDTFVQSRPAFTETEITETSETPASTLSEDVYIDLGLEESPVPEIEIDLGDESMGSPKVEVIGHRFSQVDFKQDMFLKILAAMGMDFHPKINKENDADNLYYWMLDDKNYFLTYGMPFDAKVDVFAIGDEKMSDIIRSKVNYSSVEDVYDAPDIEGLTDAITVEDKDPITGMTFRQVNETIQDLFKIDSMPKLMTLLDLSRKFGCGCGHI